MFAIIRTVYRHDYRTECRFMLESILTLEIFDKMYDIISRKCGDVCLKYCAMLVSKHLMENCLMQSERKLREKIEIPVSAICDNVDEPHMAFAVLSV